MSMLFEELKLYVIILIKVKNVIITKLSPQDVPSRTNPIPGMSDPSTRPVVALANRNNSFNIITYWVSKIYPIRLKNSNSDLIVKLLLAFIFLILDGNDSSSM